MTSTLKEHFRAQMCQSELCIFKAGAPNQASNRRTSNPLILWTFWLNWIFCLVYSCMYYIWHHVVLVYLIFSHCGLSAPRELLSYCRHPALNLRQKCDQKWTREKNLFAELSTTTSCCFIDIWTTGHAEQTCSEQQHLNISEVRHHHQYSNDVWQYK